MESVINNIKNTTQKKYMDYGRNPGSPDNDFLFMYSVARWGPSHSDGWDSLLSPHQYGLCLYSDSHFEIFLLDRVEILKILCS